MAGISEGKKQKVDVSICHRMKPSVTPLLMSFITFHGSRSSQGKLLPFVCVCDRRDVSFMQQEVTQRDGDKFNGISRMIPSPQEMRIAKRLDQPSPRSSLMAQRLTS